MSCVYNRLAPPAATAAVASAIAATLSEPRIEEEDKKMAPTSSLQRKTTVFREEKQGTYYGRNDLRPMDSKICVYVTLLVLSPIIPILFVFYLAFVGVFLLSTTIDDNQAKTSKLFGFVAWRKVPGKRL